MRKLTKLIAGGISGTAGAIIGSRFAIHRLTTWVGRILTTDDYAENLWELFSSTRRTGAQPVVEANMRSEKGSVIRRPFGSPRRFPAFDGLMFQSVQLTENPTAHNYPIDTTVTLGKRAKKPLTLRIPILIAGMAYGLALSDQTKYALAQGAALAGTASNTGEGPMLPLERKLADRLILQLPRASWNRDEASLHNADLIEISMGQGASACLGHVTGESLIDETLRQRLGLPPGQDAVIHSVQPELKRNRDIAKLVTRLRQVTDGIPIGCKIPLSGNIEADLDILIDAGIDVVALDGAQAASKGSPPIIQDDFGLPTIIGLCRAVDHLERRGVRNDVQIIVGGGLVEPGHFLKALALGADAVYVGAIAIFAISHEQIWHALPFEPPTQIVWHKGKYSTRFNWRKGAKYLANFLKSATEEMSEGARALGKTSLAQVNRNDLLALDRQTAEITNIPLAYHQDEAASRAKRLAERRRARAQRRQARQRNSGKRTAQPAAREYRSPERLH